MDWQALVSTTAAKLAYSVNILLEALYGWINLPLKRNISYVKYSD
jgi:hypothetical protein